MAKLAWSAELDPLQINIIRDERQRRELTNIDELAASIAARGQLQPIVIQRGTLNLIAGERRLTAIRKLNSANPNDTIRVRVVYSDEVDPGELQALEWEENVKRVDLPWKDNCSAIASYHRYRLGKEPKWSQADTAKALGISASEVSERLAVADALAKGDKLVTEAPKLSTAKGIVKRQTERREAAETSQLVQMVSKPVAAAVHGTPDSPAPEPAPEDNSTGFILNADFLEWAPNYTGQKFNFIHCDFPYGVGMHKSDQGSGDAYGTYEDTPEIYFKLLNGFMDHLDRFCEESAHLVFWFSMDYYDLTWRTLQSRINPSGEDRGFEVWKVNKFPLIWHKSDGSGIIPDSNRGPRRTYETAFLASRGDRKIVKPVSNSVGAPIQRGRHMSEKPQAVLAHFYRMLVDSHTRILDPTCGSGSAIRAAVAAGASGYLGLEINPTFAKHADEALMEALLNPQIDLEQLVKETADGEDEAE